MAKRITKLLVANRGEIACRIIKTARRMGIRTVALFSSLDCDAMHILAADEAYHLPGMAAVDTYLNISAICRIAVDAGVDDVHPGYGFLCS